MTTISVDAKELMKSEHPVLALSELFGLSIEQLDDLRAVLQNRKEQVLCEVLNWPQPFDLWERIANMLEGIQQHSNYFYLIWGTQDDFVNTKAASEKNVLENDPLLK